MTNKDVRETIKIEGDNYDIIYKSNITGNLGTWKDLIQGRWDKQRRKTRRKKVKQAIVSLLFARDKDVITSKDITIIALRKRTQIKEKLIVDPDDLTKERCPRCFYAKVEELANKRINISLGNNYPVLSSKVDFGNGRFPRFRETSKYCECCDTTYVAAKVVVSEY